MVGIILGVVAGLVVGGVAVFVFVMYVMSKGFRW